VEARGLKAYRFVLALSAAVIWALFATSPTSGLGALPTVRPVPPSETISSSADSFDVEIVIDNVVNLGAFQVILSFDPEVMRAKSFVRGDFMSSTDREIVCTDATIDEAAVRLECVSLGVSPPGPDGNGVLAIASFEPVGDGTSDLIITRAALAHPDGSSITPSVESVQVSIEGDSGWRFPLIIGGILFAGVLGAGVGAAVILNRRRRTEAQDAGPAQ
jgi:hypothetical protein